VPWPRSLSLPNLGLVLLVWVLIERVRFPVAGGWTRATMLAFVPALFVLPTPLVPLVAMIAIVCRQLPAVLLGRVRPAVLPTLVSDAWFTIGPVLVLVLAHAQRFTWSDWPLYGCALAAQVLFDAGAAVGWSWGAEGISPRVQLPLLGWSYIVDATLAPLGLVIAAAAANRPTVLLIAVSPAAILLLFAREREQRLEQTQALSTAYRGTALLLGDVVEADDHYTGSHSREVVDLALAVAEALRLDAGRRRDVEFAALLHDVGKILVPKEIINKRGALDPSEWDIIRRHTIDGERMLARVGGTLSNVGRIVRASHERFDGGGYPDRLAGETIPIESRIVSVCDSYSAMTTDRPYRSALSASEAVTELRDCAGTQFDPAVVDALVGLLVAPRRSPRHSSGRQPQPSLALADGAPS
jgi:HD domain-containing protein